MKNVNELLSSLGCDTEGFDAFLREDRQTFLSNDVCVIRHHDKTQRELKGRFSDLCSLDIDGEHWWVGAKSVSAAYARHASPVVISFYTNATSYEDRARELIASIEKIGGIDYYVIGIDSTGSWETNCSIKPSFILHCLHELQRPVLWVDADAQLNGIPRVPDVFDFAVHRYDGWEFASGTVYFNYNERALGLLNSWIELSQLKPLIWDQMLLDEAWARYTQKNVLVTGWLPEAYTHIFDSHVAGAAGEAPVITHYQESRSVPNKRPKPPIPDRLKECRRLACADVYEYDVEPVLVSSANKPSRFEWIGVETDLGRLMDYLYALRSDKGEKVFFLQVGAMDGVKFDPLCKRIRAQGWSGILFEPLPDIFARLVKNYEDVQGLILVNAAIDARDGTREMYRIPTAVVEAGELPDWALGISSFYNDRNALGGKKVDEQTKELIQSKTIRESVQCISFDSVLRDYAVKEMDLLQIDTEGHDWEILRSFPIETLRPKVINFEYYNLRDSELDESLAWLKAHGYAYSMDHKDVTATLLRLSAPRG